LHNERFNESEVFYEKFHENLLQDKNLLKSLDKASLNMSQ